MHKLNLITIGYSKQSLQQGSREQIRMDSYHEVLNEGHFIVFTRQGDNLPVYHEHKHIHIYGTNSLTKIGMLWDAFWLARSIVKKTRTVEWVISSQDPFETSIVGYVNAWAKNVVHHIQLHGDFYGNTAWLQESILNRLRAQFGLFVLRRASAVRVVSLRIKRSIVRLGVSPERVNVLPIEIDLQVFLDIGTKKTYADTTLIFLYVGRFAPEKNLPLLLHAFSQTYAQHKNIRLRLVGDGSEQITLKQLVKKLEIESVVDWIPWTNNIEYEYSRADVFVLTSNHEGYALVLIEAMASGLPVITTDVGCVGEKVMHGQHGLVFKKDDVSTLVTYMKRYVTDDELRKKHARTAYRQAEHIAATVSDYRECWKKSFFVS